VVTTTTAAASSDSAANGDAVAAQRGWQQHLQSTGETRSNNQLAETATTVVPRERHLQQAVANWIINQLAVMTAVERHWLW